MKIPNETIRVILNSLEVGSIISGYWTKPSSKIMRTSDKKSDEDDIIRWQKQTSAWIKADG